MKGPGLKSRLWDFSPGPLTLWVNQRIPLLTFYFQRLQLNRALSFSYNLSGNLAHHLVFTKCMLIDERFHLRGTRGEAFSVGME